MAKVDNIFIDNCKTIFNDGVSTEGYQVRPVWEDGESAHTIKTVGLVNRYNLQEEFPLMTLRKMNLMGIYEELLWMWRDKSNNVNDFNLKIWNQWADPDGSIGKTYGYQLGKVTKFKQGEMDQVDNVLWLLKNDPMSRRILTNMYCFDDLHEMNLEPCVWSMTFNVIKGELHGVLNQRSQDMLVANNWDVAQHALLLMMFAQVSGLKPGILTHVIADAHLYDRHVPIAQELITGETFDAPKVWLNPEVKDFYDFKLEDLHIENYNYGKVLKRLPVAK